MWRAILTVEHNENSWSWLCCVLFTTLLVLVYSYMQSRSQTSRSFPDYAKISWDLLSWPVLIHERKDAKISRYAVCAYGNKGHDLCDAISCKKHQQLMAKYSSVPVKHPWAFGTHWPTIGGINLAITYIVSGYQFTLDWLPPCNDNNQYSDIEKSLSIVAAPAMGGHGDWCMQLCNDTVEFAYTYSHSIDGKYQ